MQTKQRLTPASSPSLSRSRPLGHKATLRLGRPGSAAEAQAETVAHSLQRSPANGDGSGATPHRCSCGGTCPRCRATRQAAEGSEAAPASVHQVLDAPGRALDPAVATKFRRQLGHDFGRVKVHTDSAAAESARDIGAHAYTAGQNIVFAAGQYRPQSTSGQKLLAHELTHVMQQSTFGTNPALVQRQTAPGAKTAAQPAKAAKKPPWLGREPRFDWIKKSPTGKPCACVAFVHHDEQNARLTAQLMHQHCNYDLLMVEPKGSSRTVSLPGKGAVDPNQLFPPKIAQECLKNEQVCRDRVANPATAKSAEEFAQTQFFLSVYDCSRKFTLPVVALHNNDTVDTREFNKQKKAGTINFDNLKMDVAKTGTKEENNKKIAAIRKKLDTEINSTARHQLDTRRKTNIFRWCISSDLRKCHVGDPENPDQVVWVTNQDDFDRLETEDVNVALEEPNKDASSNSSKDLSNLFLVAGNFVGGQFDQSLEILLQEIERQVTLAESAQDAGNEEEALHQLEKINRLVPSFNALFSAKAPRLSQIRFINIETPEDLLKDQTDDERVTHYELIANTLKKLGLHCCEPNTTDAEGKIKSGLRVDANKKAAKDKAAKEKAAKAANK